MPRMRTLKPGFFSNDVLATVPPIGRLLFEGLWCLADKEGRLEDRPQRIKAEVLPYDKANVDQLLSTLAELEFIERYCVDSRRYIQITNFKKHQSPNSKEAESTIPAPTFHSAGTDPPPNGHGESIASHARVSDLQEQLQEQEQLTPNGVVDSDEPSPGDDRVDYVYGHFKTRVQPRSRLNPRKKIAARLKRFSVDELCEGIDHFADDPWWMENNASRGAEWFFESDARAEQFLLMKPRPTTNVVPMNGQPKRAIDAPPEVPADSPFLQFRGAS